MQVRPDRADRDLTQVAHLAGLVLHVPERLPRTVVEPDRVPQPPGRVDRADMQIRPNLRGRDLTEVAHLAGLALHVPERLPRTVVEPDRVPQPPSRVDRANVQHQGSGSNGGLSSAYGVDADCG